MSDINHLEARYPPNRLSRAIARNARLRYSSDGTSAPRGVDNAEVEVRDLSVYEQLLERVGLEVMP